MPGQAIQGPASRPSEPTVGELATMIRRHRVVGAIVGAVAAVATVVAWMLVTPLYEATAILAFEHQPQAVEFSKPSYDPVGNYENNLVNTQRDIMLSRRVLQLALDHSSLLDNKPYVAASDPLVVMRKRLDTDTRKDSWTLTVNFRDEDPARAEQTLQAILDAYEASNAARARDHASNSEDFLGGQVSETRAKLEAARQAENSFRIEKGLFTPAERSLVTQRLYNLNGKMTIVQQQLASLEELVKQIHAIPDTPADTRLDRLLSIEFINRHPSVIEQQKLLYELQARRASLAQKYLERHPRMIEINEQISSKREQLVKVVDMVCSSIESEHVKQQNQSDKLAENIKRDEEELSTYHSNMLKLDSLIDSTKVQDELYQQLLKRAAEQEVTARLDNQHMSLVSSPTAGPQAVNISAMWIIYSAFGAAVLTGLLGALVAGFLDQVVHGVKDLARVTDLPILGEIPRGAEATGSPVESPFARLRTNLHMATGTFKQGLSAPRSCEVISICSASAGEGRSSVAHQLAVSMANAGSQVLLVDGDLLGRSLTTVVGTSSARGLSAILAGEEGISPVPTANPNLEFLDAGEATGDTSALLNSHCLPEWIAHCRKFYGHIIFDTSPILTVPDAVILAEHVDIVLLVAREDVTLRSRFASMLSALERLESKVRGIVYTGKAADSAAEGNPWRALMSRFQSLRQEHSDVA